MHQAVYRTAKRRMADLSGLCLSARDLLRRGMYLIRKRAELLAHVQNTNNQYKLPDIGKKIAYKANREGVAERFQEPSIQTSIEVNLKLMDHYDKLLDNGYTSILHLTLLHKGLKSAICVSALQATRPPHILADS